MEIICVSIIFLLSVLYLIEYCTFWYYLSENYPLTLSWLKGGSYFEKGRLLGFNIQRDLSLMFQKSNRFQERFKNVSFIDEYKHLIINKRYQFRKGFLSITFVLWFIVLILFLTIGVLDR